MIDASNYPIKDSIISNPATQTTVNNVNTEYWSCPFECLFPTTPVSSALTCNGASYSSNAKIFDNNLDKLCSNYNWSYSASRLNNVPIDFYQDVDTNHCSLTTHCTLISDTIPKPNLTGEFVIQ